MWLDDRTIITANYLNLLVIDIRSGKVIRRAGFSKLTGKKFYPGKIPFFYDSSKRILITFSKLPVFCGNNGFNNNNF